ncbi:MAG: SDR family NAD(P)-dependent oxidoreductase [Bdellovibrionia bacterium]
MPQNLPFQKALVTGATAGIGRATVEQLSAAGLAVIACGRRQDRLAEMEKSLGVQTLAFDLSNRSECERVFLEHKATLEGVDVLVNNAGLARGLDAFQDGKFDDWDEMIDTNVKGLLYVTRAVLPGMIARDRGHIVNLGSVAGRWAYPKGGVYCASKFAVRALSESLRMDLIGTKIRVTNIEPGMVETEFSLARLGDPERAKSVYKGMTPLTAGDIAETILWSLSRPARVNIQELVIFPTDQASMQSVHRRT